MQIVLREAVKIITHFHLYCLSQQHTLGQALPLQREVVILQSKEDYFSLQINTYLKPSIGYVSCL